MHYVACGDPGRPLMLFVHGFPECWLAWEAQLQAFGGDYYAVAPDTRGINESSGPDETRGYRVGKMVDDLLHLLDHLGHRTCVLIGHDWGGAIACAFAIAHSDRLRGLVLINAVHPAVYRRELVANPAQQAASAYMNFFLSEEAEAAVCANDHAYLLAMFEVTGPQGNALPSAWLDTPLREAYIRNWSRPGSVRAGLAYYRASPLHPASTTDPGAQGVVFDEDAMRVDVPTLVIWGERDRFLLQGCLKGLEQHIPDVRVLRIAEGSHWVIHEQGTRVNHMIAGFLADRVDIL